MSARQWLDRAERALRTARLVLYGGDGVSLGEGEPAIAHAEQFVAAIIALIAQPQEEKKLDPGSSPG